MPVYKRMHTIYQDFHDAWIGRYDFYKPHILSNTSFSMKNIPPYSGEGRQGYSYNSSDGSMGPGANTGYTCGVKDVR